MLIDDLEFDVEIDGQHELVVVAVQTRTDKPGEGRQALVSFRFMDEEGHALELESAKKGGHYVVKSPEFGYFVYTATSSSSASWTSAELPVPEGARRLRVRGRGWMNPGGVVVEGEPVISLRRRGADSEFDALPGSDAVRPVHVDDFIATYPVDPETVYEVSTCVSGPRDSQAAFMPVFYDQDGVELLPTGALAMSMELGEYFYARQDEAGEILTVITTPPRAVLLKLRARQWRGGDVHVLSRPIVSERAEESERTSDAQLRTLLREIPAHERLVVVYTTAGSMGSSTLLLRSNRLAIAYAEAGWNVVFFPFSNLKDEESERPRERIIQLSRSRFRVALDELARRRGPNNVLLCSTFTDVRMVGTVDRLHDLGWRVVYEVRDDMEEFKRVGYAKWYDPALELRFAKRADRVVAVSPRLADKISVVSGKDVVLIPNGVPDELCAGAAHLRTVEAWAVRTRMRKIGYIGHLTDSWFDWSLFLAAADRVDAQFELIGHGVPEDIQLPRNVTYLGAMPHSECLAYAAEWCAGLIPFKISPLTYGVDPNKAYEYVAMGLRTISAPMGQVASIPGAWVYEDQDGLVDAVEFALNNPLNDRELSELEEYAHATRWSIRAADMLKVLEGC